MTFDKVIKTFKEGELKEKLTGIELVEGNEQEFVNEILSQFETEEYIHFVDAANDNMYGAAYLVYTDDSEYTVHISMKDNKINYVVVD